MICTVTSSSILLASPFFAAYRASKAAMSAVCETLLVELAPFGIRVLEVLPGPVATDGLVGSDYVDAVEHEPYRAAAERMMASRERVHELAVTPAAAAVRIVDAIVADAGPMRSSTVVRDHPSAAFQPRAERHVTVIDAVRLRSGSTRGLPPVRNTCWTLLLS